MALNHDNQGFLIGDPIDLGKIPQYLLDIKRDIAAIKSATFNPGKKSGSSRQPAAPAAVGQRTVVAMPKRASNGRFMPSQNQKPVEPKRVASANVNALLSRMGNATRGGLDAAGQIDPAAQAAREVAEPMKRAVSMFKRDDNTQTGLLRKIFKSMNLFHKEDTTYNKATKKILKSIEEKPGGVGGTSIFSNNGGGGGLPGLSRGLFAGGLLGLLTKAGRGAKGLFKRIPVIGSLLAGAGAAFDIYGSESDPTMTRAQKDAAAGKSAGGWAGSLAGIGAGAMAGSAAGPIGTIVGGVVGGFLGDQAGQIIGEKFGTWVSDLRQADIPGKLVSKFEEATGGFDFKKGFALWLDRTGSNLTGAGNIVGEQLNDLNNYTKANTGIDFKKMGAAWWDRTKASAGEAWDTLSGVPSFLLNNTTLGKAGSRAAKSIRSKGETGSPERAMQILMQKGWSKDDAAAIAASLNSESGFNTTAVGDKGKAIGAAQWHKPRQDQFKKLYGKNIAEASFEEQVNFVDWELRNTHKKAGDNIRAAGTLDKKTALVEQQYEISSLGMKGGVQPQRIADARRYAKIASVSAPSFRATAMPTAPKIADAPIIREQLNTQKPEVQTVRIENNNDASQEISDRRMAHIIAGGIGHY
ncbi:phage tail tip lysozyme [Methylomonas methanica]|uniref:Phage tail lysozyme domain-containing protein n=1 Tax=Methylomonas methanica (strain DSM 25384 / MC09) TaxID=857087 RepID=G0A3T5_METMM|nr:phage tail tip lysozyme [Methylomonas methanica]AEG02707.1 hypothetical protein Metme_4359 [Methylomonas methanica MC09]